VRDGWAYTKQESKLIFLIAELLKLVRTLRPKRGHLDLDPMAVDASVIVGTRGTHNMKPETGEPRARDYFSSLAAGSGRETHHPLEGAASPRRRAFSDPHRDLCVPIRE